MYGKQNDVKCIRKVNIKFRVIFYPLKSYHIHAYDVHTFQYFYLTI